MIIFLTDELEPCNYVIILLLFREVDTPYSIQIPELEVSKVSLLHFNK